MIKSIMKAGITRILFVVLFLAAGITYITWSFQSASITKARSLLQEALDRIETPAAGQIAYYTYQQFRRGPDPALEPPDPYHKPYSAIWLNAEQIETWLEVGLDGKTTRWRTQSRDEDGTLLQDLYFDGAVETDYYPLDEFAEKFPMETEKFRDFRVSLIEDYLLNERLVHKPNVSSDGRSILSIYTERVPISDDSSWKKMNVDEALLSFQNPFVADLTISSTANRIDFDLDSSLPIGAGQVIFTSNDVEVVVSYQTFGSFDILSKDEAESQGVFELDIPERALDQFYVAPSGGEAINDIKDILKSVDYPLYGLESSAVPFKLVSANLKPLETSYKSPSFRRGINFAARLGIGPMIEYANSDESMRLRVIQGPKKIMQETFLQTLPDWVKSTQIQVRLGHKDVTGWNLINPQSNLVRIVLETGETVIYVEGEGIQFDQLVQLLGVFEVLG